MPKILITGNGFDLHHHLPTKYNDFVNIINYLNSNTNYSFDSVFENSDSYYQIQNNFLKNIIFDEDKIKLIKEISSKNLLLKFFNSEYEIGTWIDFETKIEYLLNNIFHSVRLIRENILKSDSIFIRLGYSIASLNNNYEYLETLTFLNVITHNNVNIYFNDTFLVKKYGRYINFNEEKLLDMIYSELIEFRKLFNLYLQTFILPLYDNYSNKDFIVNGIVNKINYYFTFNYTPTFENLYLNSKKGINYLHGKSLLPNENIVFGVNEVINDEFDRRLYLKFTKYYQKMNNKTDFRFTSIFDEYLGRQYVFYFWGHSLDESDASYINEVFDFSIPNGEKKIVIIYHNEHSRSKMLLNLLSIRGRKDIEDKQKNFTLLFYHVNSEELQNELDISLYDFD